MPRPIFHGWLAIAGLIAALSLWPEGLVADHYYLDKLAHLVAYGTLAAIPALFSTSQRTVLMVAAGLIAVSAGLELAQYILPHRWPSLFDLAANIIGVCGGTLSAWLLRKILLSIPHPHRFIAKMLLQNPPARSQQTHN